VPPLVRLGADGRMYELTSAGESAVADA
jgi:hypothetical protein